MERVAYACVCVSRASGARAAPDATPRRPNSDQKCAIRDCKREGEILITVGRENIAVALSESVKLFSVFAD